LVPTYPSEYQSFPRLRAAYLSFARRNHPFNHTKKAWQHGSLITVYFSRRLCFDRRLISVRPNIFGPDYSDPLSLRRCGVHTSPHPSGSVLPQLRWATQLSAFSL
jgi:hypothetical protein